MRARLAPASDPLRLMNISFFFLSTRPFFLLFFPSDVFKLKLSATARHFVTQWQTAAAAAAVVDFALGHFKNARAVSLRACIRNGS